MEIISESLYKFGCVMLSFPESDVERLHKAQRAIQQTELAASGREWDSHLTLRYGTIDGDFQRLYDDARDYFEQIQLTVTGVSVFDTKDGDCVKFDVATSPALLSMRSLVERIFKCKVDDHPVYHPHITISYVEKGRGNLAAARIRDMFKFPFNITASGMFYTTKEGKRHLIPLRSAMEHAAESLATMVAEKYKHPILMMAKIVVPKGAFSPHAIKKHAKSLEEVGGKYERHEDGRDIFRVPQLYAKSFYHRIYNTRGVIPDKKEPELSYY